MKEIKFRAWNKVYKKYVEINELEMGVKSLAIKFITPSGRTLYLEHDNSIILEQYTGLKDKNGVEIHEGDIVEVGSYCVNEVELYSTARGYYRSGDKLVIVSVIPLLDIRSVADYNRHIENKSEFFWGSYYIRPRATAEEFVNFQSSMTVVGNIHENGELLK